MSDLTLAHHYASTLVSRVRGLALPAFRLRDERAGDVAAREALLDDAFGASRFEKTCERLREGRAAADGLSFVAMADGKLVGTLRFWHVEAGDRVGLMLGPLAVSTVHRSLGIGRAMIDHGLHRARKLGHPAVILVGDAPYYGRFGFDAGCVSGLALPGPVDRNRFLGLELVPGGLAKTRGRVVGTGLLVERRDGDELRLAA